MKNYERMRKKICDFLVAQANRSNLVIIDQTGCFECPHFFNYSDSCYKDAADFIIEIVEYAVEEGITPVFRDIETVLNICMNTENFEDLIDMYAIDKTGKCELFC